jgi:hypothetical protein
MCDASVTCMRDAGVAASSSKISGYSRKDTIMEADLYARMGMEMKAQGYIAQSKVYLAECIGLLRELDNHIQVLYLCMCTCMINTSRTAVCACMFKHV